MNLTQRTNRSQAQTDSPCANAPGGGLFGATLYG